MPETMCRDVMDLCKEPGEVDCYLAEMWRGTGEYQYHSFTVLWFLNTTISQKISHENLVLFTNTSSFFVAMVAYANKESV